MKSLKPLKKSKRKPSLKNLKKKCWTLCSEYNRLIHSDAFGKVRCYTCGLVMDWKESQAGHMIGGRNNAILFCDEIIRPQCVRCNIFLHGNYGMFARKFIEEFGIKEYDSYVEFSKKPQQLKEYQILELIEAYKNKLATMGKGGE